RAVGPFTDAADPAVEISQQPFLADDALVFEDEANERLRRKRRDEEIALPRRKQLPGVEADAGRRDVGGPEVHRLLHPRLRRLVAVDWLAGVLAAVADRREPVVPAL